MDGRAEVSLSIVVVVHDMARELPRTLASLGPAGSTGSTPTTTRSSWSTTGRTHRSIRGWSSRSPATLGWSGWTRRRRRPYRPPTTGSPSPGRPRRAADRRRPTRLARPARRRPGGRAVLRAAAHHRARLPPRLGHAHAGARGRLRPGGRRRAPRGLGAGRTTATGSSRSARRPARRAGACSARWARAAACSLRRDVWDELGGLDERFALPAGGLANHDLYRRACALDGIQLIVLLGEGTFHQYHGGAATSRRFTWDDMHADYQAIRGGGTGRPPTIPSSSGACPRPRSSTSSARPARRSTVGHGTSRHEAGTGTSHITAFTEFVGPVPAGRPRPREDPRRAAEGGLLDSGGDGPGGPRRRFPARSW